MSLSLSGSTAEGNEESRGVRPAGVIVTRTKRAQQGQPRLLSGPGSISSRGVNVPAYFFFCEKANISWILAEACRGNRFPRLHGHPDVLP